MPVPLATHVTFREFRDHLLWLGCRYGKLARVQAPRPQIYFERDNPDSSLPWDAVMDELKDSDPVEATLIQSVCSQLHISPDEFGFNLPP